MDKKAPKRKLLIPKPTVTTIPSITKLIDEAKVVIGSQIAQFRYKTDRGSTLDLKEARVLTGYLDALTRASKEARETARSEDLSDLSNEELQQLVHQLAKPKQDSE